MMMVKTKTKHSDIAGIGLFADEFIAKGTIVWKYEPKLDLLLSKEEVEVLSDSAKEQFMNYAYFDEGYQKYLLCGDDARFFNHSINPNCLDDRDHTSADVTIAAKDIFPDEELTCDYRSFYGDLDQHPELA